MKSRNLVLALVVATTPAHAQVSIGNPVPDPANCAEAQAMKNWYDTCVSWVGPALAPQYCTPPPVTQCWDFEAGLAPWTVAGPSGGAFTAQPTYGDNVSAQRVLATQPSGIDYTRTMLQEMQDIGGDYWNLPRPVGHEGTRWIGTYEDRPSGAIGWGRTQGNSPTGSLISPTFTVDREYVTFLVGGGCNASEERVELQVLQPAMTLCTYRCRYYPPTWVTAQNPFADFLEMKMTGRCSEIMERRMFRTDAASGLQGRTARLVIVDNGTGTWGHINVDDVRHTSILPKDFNRKNVPLWGFADTHVHVGAELSMRSLGAGFPSTMTLVAGADGALIHGSTGTITQDRNTLSTQLGSCDAEGHGTNHGAKVFVETLEASSLGESANYPLGCWEGNALSHLGTGCTFWGKGPVQFVTPKGQQHPNGGMQSPPASGLPGGDDFVGWPYWYTRAHQLVHLTWLQRAYAGGQRLIVASAGNNETLGMMMRRSDEGTYLSDYGALRRFALTIKRLAAANPGWMEIAYSPSDARRIVNSDKLAIVLATEVDDLGSKCNLGNFGNTADDDPLDHGKTVKTSGDKTYWGVGRDLADADSCTTVAQWQKRVDDLYNVGYRVVMPVHLADNDLGGTAVYSELFNTNSEFMTGSFISTTLDSRAPGRDVANDVTYTYAQDQHNPGNWYGNQAGWTRNGQFGGVASYTPAPIPTHVPYTWPADHYTNMMAAGFLNTRALSANGIEVIKAAMAHGMIIDVAHLDQAGRERILGLGTFATGKSSPLAPSCDLSDPACQRSAYPAISSHAGFRELMMPRDESGGGPTEGALTKDMIGRIAAIGGTVGVGVSAGDARDVDAATGSGPWGASTVSNRCAGSTRTFAQTYQYALRRTGGKGITLGTDFNGLEDRLNPRYGSLACHARGNIPWVLQRGSNGTLLVDQQASMPYKFRPSLLGGLSGERTAREQAMVEMSAPGLNYQHYIGTPPSGGRFLRLADPANYVANLKDRAFDKIRDFGFVFADSMKELSTRPALMASQTGNRTFDLNYDGFAHYGMLPDVLQDTVTLGLRSDQLEPLFRGAEDFVQTWERGCKKSNPSFTFGCN